MADDDVVPEDAIDYAEVLRRGGQNFGDEDFALFKRPRCGQVYLLEYEVDTVYLDGRDLTRRLPVCRDSFPCEGCREMVPRGAWAGPKAADAFRVTWGELAASEWAWAARRDPDALTGVAMELDPEIRDALARRPLHRLPSGVEVVDLSGGPGHGFMMSLDGRVFEWDWDTDEREVVDPVQRRLAFVSAKAIPELMRLVPERPHTATDCEECDGTGRRTMGSTMGWLCNTCGGVGWREGAPATRPFP